MKIKIELSAEDLQEIIRNHINKVITKHGYHRAPDLEIRFRGPVMGWEPLTDLKLVVQGSGEV